MARTIPLRPTAVVFFALLAATRTSNAQTTVLHYSFWPGELPQVSDRGGSSNIGQAGPLARLSNETPAAIVGLGVPENAGRSSLDTSAAGAAQGSPSGLVSSETRSLSNAAIAAAGGFTMECWFRWNGGGDINAAIDYAGTEKIVVQAGGRVEMLIDGTPTQIGTAQAGEWHYVAVIFDTGGNSVDGDGAITGTLRAHFDTLGAVVEREGVRKSDFGDSLDRPIGIGQHPLGFDRDFFDGLIFEPRVSLGALAPGELLFEPPAPSDIFPLRFRRGDVNHDRNVDIADAIAVLQYLFVDSESRVAECLDAADANDSGEVTIADPVHVLGYLFQGESPPPAPGPSNCGADPTEDALGCRSSDFCLGGEPGYVRIIEGRIDGEEFPSAIAFGETFELEVEFAVKNDLGCLDCRRQVVIGWNGQARACIYDGVPHPTEERIVRRTIELTAPTSQAFRQIYAVGVAESSCEAAMAHYSEALAPIVAFEVFGPPPGPVVESVDLNGEGPEITVPPGAPIHASVVHTLSNSRSDPGAKTKFVFGFAGEALGCSDHGVPVVAPKLAAETTAVADFSAPTRAGTYALYAAAVVADSCETALRQYGRRDPSEETPIATIHVAPGAYATDLRIFREDFPGGIVERPDALPGQEISIEVSWSAINDPESLATRRSLVVGLEGVPIGCVYSDVPGVETSQGRSIFTMVAPRHPGTYAIDVRPDSGATGCQDAVNRYIANWPDAATNIGTLTVLEGAFVTGVRLSVDGVEDGSRELTVEPGKTIDVEVDYSAANATPNMSRRLQLVVGTGGSVRCIYDGVPPANGAAMGTTSFSFTPAVPGKVDLVPEWQARTSCALATANFTGGAPPVASIRVGPVTITEARVNGVRFDNGIIPPVVRGAEMSLTVLWTPPAQPCNCQLFLWDSAGFLDYGDARCPFPSAIDPGSTGVIFHAPERLGRYPIWWSAEFETTCAAGRIAAATGGDENSQPGPHQLIGYYEVVDALPLPESVPPELEPATENLSPPEKLDVTWEGLQNDGFLATLKKVLNSEGDSLELSITVSGEVSLFKAVSAGGSVTFGASLARVANESGGSDNYEISFSLEETRNAGVGLGEFASVGVEGGIGGTMVITVSELEKIPDALQQFAIALVLEPASGAINAVIDALNITINFLDDQIVEVERLLEDIANAAEAKAECVSKDWTLALPWNVKDCAVCAAVILQGRLAVLRQKRAKEDEERSMRMDAIGKLGDAKSYFSHDSEALVGISFEFSTFLGANAGASLSPFEGVSLAGLSAGVTLSSTLSLAARIELDGNGDPDKAVFTLGGEIDFSPELFSVTGSATTGIEIESEWDIQSGSYSLLDDTKVTLFSDVQATLITGIIGRSGLGRHVEVEIPLKEFKRASQELSRLLSGQGSSTDLGLALAGIEADFTVQDRRTVGAELGIEIDAFLVTIGFSASLTWTDAAPAITFEGQNLGAGLELLFSRDTLTSFGNVFQAKLLAE